MNVDLDVIDRRLGKQEADEISSIMITQPEVEKQVIRHFLKREIDLGMKNAAYLLFHYFNRYPSRASVYTGIFINQLKNEGLAEPVIRTILHVFEKKYTNPENDEYFGFLIDKCFLYLDSSAMPTGIRVYAMTILYHALSDYPELKSEFIEILRAHLDYGSAGFQNRAKKYLKDLSLS